ncbi:tripartite tricarboxylate transporter substrate-binding protein [Bradyrhizobium sp. Ai1a-2]|uniref:Bug family tripartite tricarboxylate transporter substrate binding protein n=1 Tax=Bradyrhizobium sp. Ai1a-2 TaxID=196490 RepID=UPI000408C533|nr:tripartite tricarboxylate transporter substrate-binding protein [Bradyrhizobium sp. Ai1a-2]
MRLLITSAAIAWGLIAVPQIAEAQNYPNKPIRVFVSSTAGGPLDVFTRLVTHKMEERLHQPFVIENRSGAGGNIAAAGAAQAEPDGYTVLFSIDTTFTVNPSLFKQNPVDLDKDFVPLSVLAKFGQALGVPSTLPVSSLADLIELSRKKDLGYGSSGTGSPAHLAFSYLQAVSGLKATHIPYRGNPPALLALLNGDIQAAMVVTTSLLPLAQESKVKLLAYSDSTRSEAIPDVPTVAELGYPNFEAVFGYVMLVPANTPKSIADVLFTEATHAVMEPDVREKLKSTDTVPIALSSRDSVVWLHNSRKKWADVITKMNVSAE